MDIYKILEALQGVDEGGYPFAGKAVGQKPGDQVRGTEKAKKKASGEHPFKGRLVGASESVEMECDAPMTLTDKLRARWEQTKREKGLQEYGMTTGGTISPQDGSNPQQSSTADKAKEVAQVQQNVNKLKSAGVNIPSTSQAVQSLTKEPGKEPASALDKNIAAGLGQEVEQLLTKGDPGSINQLTSLIRKVKQQGNT